MLDPALKQINDDPLGAGFSVEYTPIRKGRFYNELVFQITKTPKRIQTDKLIKRNAGDARKIKAAKERGRPALLDTDINRAAQETRYELDMNEIQRQFWAQYVNSCVAQRTAVQIRPAIRATLGG
ncbi:replication initiation protein [Planktotalea arctica]|uniref:replication initiation protein n=1 Tax=Planktotalea arctica TaxID=1481893 RepID=UPI000A170F83|nr:replication initiation protein [Planktotalea arctica]